MSGNTYSWTKDNTYCIITNANTKTFSIDFFPNSIDKSKYSILFNNVKFLKNWYMPGTKSCLIVLKDSTYLYIKEKIIMFKLEKGDMLVRPVTSRDNNFTAIMTRFHTIIFNEKSAMSHLVSKDNLRPPELNIGFVVNEEFNSKYATIWSDFSVIHDADLTRTLLLNNL